LIKYSVAAVLVAGILLAVTGSASAGGAQCGGASWYGPGFNGKKTASGERFNQNAMTAAHKTLPMGTVVRVVDQRTGKSIKVTINDRGPFAKGRIIDLSKAAAAKLGFQARGHTKVCIS
jgi:rare lipoprotein A